MNNLKKLAVLGFLPDAESQLKQLVESKMGTTAEWVTATDPSLEGVIINADFLGSVQIDKYIQRTNARVVCCYRDEDGKQQAATSNVTGIHITQHDGDAVADWLEHLTGERYSQAPEQSRQQIQPQVQAPEQSRQQIQAQIQAQATSTQASRQSAAATEQTAASTGNDSADNELFSDYNSFIQTVKQPNTFLYAKVGDKQTWIDTNAGKVYMNYDRDSIPAVDTQEWRQSDNISNPDTSRHVKLELWLFESIWQSQLDVVNEIGDKLYKLTRWPRPLSNKGRSEALRLAAFAQSSPVSVRTLVDKTQYSDAVVRRFLYAALSVGQLREASAAEIDRAQQNASQQQKPDKAKLGLLGRLRKKLGIG